MKIGVIGGTRLIRSKVIEKLKVPLGEARPRPHRFRRSSRAEARIRQPKDRAP